MSDLKVSGDLEGVSVAHLNVIKSAIESLGFKNNEVTIECVGKAGDNYIANVKRIVVHGDYGDFKLIAKLAPTNAMIRMTTNADRVFKNEVLVYTDILPKYEKYFDEADVPENERFKSAKFYGYSLEEMNEIILLEDLVESGYGILDRLVSLSNEHVRTTLKDLAIYHALSYVLKHREPKKFEELQETLFNPLSTDSPQAEMFFNMFLKQIAENTLSILQKTKHKKIVSELFGNAKNIMKDLIESDKGARCTVIHHGDAWTNNLMFRDGEKSPELIMIDYQQAKVGNPVSDLLYLTVNCTDYETRKQHFHEWIDYYHSVLEGTLSNFGLKANLIFPKDKLDADLVRYGKLGLLFGIMMNGVLIAKPEEAKQMQTAMKTDDVQNMVDSTIISLYSQDTIAMFKTRTEGVINSFIELGLINVKD